LKCSAYQSLAQLKYSVHQTYLDLILLYLVFTYTYKKYMFQQVSSSHANTVQIITYNLL